MSDPELELREELVRLRAAMARRLRAKLEGDDPVTPAWFEAARKFLSDQLEPERPRPAPPVTRDLPFPAEDE